MGTADSNQSAASPPRAHPNRFRGWWCRGKSLVDFRGTSVCFWHHRRQVFYPVERTAEPISIRRPPLYEKAIRGKTVGCPTSRSYV